MKDGSIRWYRSGKPGVMELENMPAAGPSRLTSSEWQYLFTSWLDGSLDRQIEQLSRSLPTDNVQAIEGEKLK